MDGSDVLRIMRKTDEWQTTQVVVVTANPHMVTEDIRTLADYVLQKPVDIPPSARWRSVCMPECHLSDDSSENSDWSASERSIIASLFVLICVLIVV